MLDPLTWLPTTLFLGKGGFEVSARSDVLLAPVTNPFLLPTGLNNRFWYKTYFSTYAPDSAVRVTSLGGDVTLRNEVVLPSATAPVPILQAWLNATALLNGNSAAFSQPWLRAGETSMLPFETVLSLAPPVLQVAALSGDVNVTGSFTLAPAARGTLELLAAGSINALQPAGVSNALVTGQTVTAWTSGGINLSDANPAALPGVMTPFAYHLLAGRVIAAANTTDTGFLNNVNALFAETGATGGVIQTKQALHTPGLLHAGDPEPIRLYALGGGLSGLTLFAPKPARIHVAGDLMDVAFYLQNLADTDQTVISADRDIIPYNANTPRRAAALTNGQRTAAGELPLAGDIRLSGPGSLVVLAGRHLDLGTGETSNTDGTGAGLTTIGNARNPYLPFAGADIIAGAGLGPVVSLAENQIAFADFISEHVEGGLGATYLAELGVADFAGRSVEERHRIALEVFYLMLRDTGRQFAATGSYATGFAAIESLFPGVTGPGDIFTRGRNVRTSNGGDISLLAPGGALTLANTIIGNPLIPPGIITESGGKVSIFTHHSVDIGIGRIFTLRGGDMVIWSSAGDIAAGSASKTVASAPPTRVLIDPQSADVATDLAGLSTGGGIGVLATVEGVPPGSVDLLAPAGVIDAGDAGIRSAGNLTLAATQVLNASNIAVTGSSAGAPAAAPGAPALSVAAPPPPPSTAASPTETVEKERSATQEQAVTEDLPSIVSVQVLGYGGGDGGRASEDDEEEEDERRESTP